MKSNIHPLWHSDCKVTCSCGNAFETGSTLSELNIDICNKCHPFFTGEVRFVDQEGRVEKFQNKMKNASKWAETKKTKKSDKSKSQVAKSLKEMLDEVKKSTDIKN